MGIDFQKVNFAYYIPKKKATIKFTLKDIDLNIKANDEFITILGHTGSGKSTLVQLMNALLLPYSGNLRIFGDLVSSKKKIKLKPIRKKVGLVFQFPEYQVFEENVLKEIMFGPKNFGFPKDELEKIALETAKRVGIDSELLNRSPFTLSGGQLRKVAIASILASDPNVLILDEPTVGLDPIGKKELMELLVKYNRDYHKTIIMITHDMEVVSKYSKRTICLNHGNILFDGASKDVFKNEELKKSFNLDYPQLVKVMDGLKQKLNIDLDIYKYTVDDAFIELKRVLGEAYE